MNTTQYLKDLLTQKQNIVNIINSQGFEATNDEKLNTLIPKLKECVDQGISENEANNIYASTIKQNVSDEVIVVNDVSSIEHNLDINVRSKNLFDISQLKTNSVITNNGDGTVAIVANSTYSLSSNTLSSLCPQLKAGDSVTFGFVTQSTYYLGIYLTTSKYMWKNGINRIITQTDLDSKVVFYGFNSTEENYGTENIISNIQIEYGSTATEYTPYIEDFSNVVISRYGTDENDNLLTATATTDGTVEGLTSLSPNMTLTSDTMGTIIDCKYNTDTKTYIDNKNLALQTAILEAGGS